MHVWKIWWFIKAYGPDPFFLGATILCAFLGWMWLAAWLGIHLVIMVINLLFNEHLRQRLRYEFTKEQEIRKGRRELACSDGQFDPDQK